MIKTLSSGLIHSEFRAVDGYPQLELVREPGDGSTVRISDLFEATAKIGAFLQSRPSKLYQKPRSLILNFEDAMSLLETLTGYKPEKRRFLDGYAWAVSPERIINFKRGSMTLKVIGHVAVLTSYGYGDDVAASKQLTKVIEHYVSVSSGYHERPEVYKRPCVHFCVLPGHTSETTYVIVTYGDVAMIVNRRHIPHDTEAIKTLPLNMVVSSLWGKAVAKTKIDSHQVAITTFSSTLTLFQIVGCRDKAYIRGSFEPIQIDIRILD